jgi:hypothetical protein
MATDINTLTSALKHELNGLLTGVKTGLEVMGMDDYFEDPDIKEEFDDIMKSANKIQAHIQDINLIYSSIESINLNNKELLANDFIDQINTLKTTESIEFAGVDIDDAFHATCDPHYLSRLIFYISTILTASKVELSEVNLSMSQSNESNELKLSHSSFPEELLNLLEKKESSHAKVSLNLHTIDKLCGCLNAKLSFDSQSLTIVF